MAKELRFRGDSRVRLRAFPAAVRLAMGRELRRVQEGHEPNDSKPMPSVGPGVREVRVRDPSGAYRTIYVATPPEAVYVLHAFQKKTRKTATSDFDLAKTRLKALLRERN